MDEVFDFWEALDELIAACRLVIDRPLGSAHPRYPEAIYPLDYGYLENTTAGDGQGIDVWLGSLRPPTLVGLVCAVDLLKRDLEIKLLLGCTEAEKEIVLSFSNGAGKPCPQKATLVNRLGADAVQPELAWAIEIAQRHSVRRFSGQIVPESILQRIIQAAQLAPSAHNRQPWRFVVLRHEQSRRVLAEALAVEFRRDLRADGLAEDQVAAQVERSYQRITQAPAAILVCLETSLGDTYPDERRQAFERQMGAQSVAMAGENLLLSAAGEGLGGVWLCAPLFAQEAARIALDLPVSWEPQGLVLLGFPASANNQVFKRSRMSLDQVTRWM